MRKISGLFPIFDFIFCLMFILYFPISVMIFFSNIRGKKSFVKMNYCVQDNFTTAFSVISYHFILCLRKLKIHRPKQNGASSIHSILQYMQYIIFFYFS